MPPSTKPISRVSPFAVVLIILIVMGVLLGIVYAYEDTAGPLHRLVGTDTSGVIPDSSDLSQPTSSDTIDPPSSVTQATMQVPTTPSGGYYRSGQVIYYGDSPSAAKPIAGADASTFVLLLGTFDPSFVGNPGVREATLGYARDSQHVYYKGAALSNVDPKTFEPLSNGDYYQSYGTDGTRVYFGATLLPNANPETFIILWKTVYEGCGFGQYATDGTRVYFKDKLVAGADANTFEALMNGEDPSGAYGNFGRDTKGIYKDGIFAPALPKTFKSVCNFG